jgi:hypothetical protein
MTWSSPVTVKDAAAAGEPLFRAITLSSELETANGARAHLAYLQSVADRVEIVWHRRETSRQTEKTKIDLRRNKRQGASEGATEPSEVSRGHSRPARRGRRPEHAVVGRSLNFE